MDDRQRRLHEWVQGLTHISISKWGVLNGDASFRRYFRVVFSKRVFNELDSLIAVDSPPAHENQKSFLEVRELLSKHGLPAPELFAEDLEQGFMLLSDFGDHLFHSNVSPLSKAPSVNNNHSAQIPLEQSKDVYKKALSLLKSMCTIPQSDLGKLPAYDEATLSREMRLFDDWFIARYLEQSLDNQQQEQLLEVKRLLIQSAISQPQVFVHRDFHSRNLMIRDDSSLGLIDFQDAVLGPITYDVVSLLKDAYVDLPINMRLFWLTEFYRSLNLSVDFKVFSQWFDWMGLQRHLKVLGIFARLKIRDNKPNYERDLPLVMRYVLEVVSTYPEFSMLDRLINENLLPRWQLLYGVIP